MAPSYSEARALRTPAVSEPQSGWPPTQRPCSSGVRASISIALVLPTSLTTASGRATAWARRTCDDDEPHRRADEDEIGGGGSLFEALRRLGDGATLEGGGDGLGAAAVADHPAHAGELACGEPEGAAHEADADDGDAALCLGQRSSRAL